MTMQRTRSSRRRKPLSKGAKAFFRYHAYREGQQMTSTAWGTMHPATEVRKPHSLLLESGR